MLTRRSFFALVDVLATIHAFVPRGARASVGSVDGRRVADGIRVAWVGGARIIQVAQQSCLPGRALAIEAAHPIHARGSVEARRSLTIVDVLAARGSRPAVDADAREAAHGVGARRAVLAHARPHGALVHVLLAQLARVGRRAAAGVAVDIVHAGRAVLTQVPRAVVDVLLAILAAETHRALALIAEGVHLSTFTIILAWRRVARDVLAFAVLSSVARVAHAFVGAVCVVALPAHTGVAVALHYVIATRAPREARRTRALEGVPQGSALASVATRLRRAVVLHLAMRPGVSLGTGARVSLETLQRAGAAVHARVGIARVGHGYLAQRRHESDGAGAGEGGRGGGRDLDVARAAILAARLGTRVARVQVLAVLAHVHGGAIAIGLLSG